MNQVDLAESLAQAADKARLLTEMLEFALEDAGQAEISESINNLLSESLAIENTIATLARK